jgi:hypothetical protein
MNKEMKER